MASAQSSPSQCPCIIRKGLFLSCTTISKISLSCVPTRMWSPRQQTLLTDKPSQKWIVFKINAVITECWLPKSVLIFIPFYTLDKRNLQVFDPHIFFNYLYCFLHGILLSFYISNCYPSFKTYTLFPY